MALAERLYQLDLERQMLRVVRRDAMQFLEQLRSDPLRLRMPHAVYHAVSRRLHCGGDARLFEPVDQHTRGAAMVAGFDPTTLRSCAGRVVDGERRAGKPDALDPSAYVSQKRFGKIVKRELDAR